MDLEELKLKNVLYYMQSFILTVGNTTFDVPRTMIGSLQVNKQFEDMVYPLYYISAQLPNWLYQEMVKDPDNIRVTMNLQYTLVDDPDKAQAGNSQLITEIQGRFLVIIPTTTQIGDASHQNQIAKSSGSFNQSYEYSEEASVEMAIYNEAAYRASFKNLNKIFQNVNLTDLLTWSFNKCGITNVLFDKADNNKSFSQFVILPQSGMKNILRLADEFKFHDGGSIVFFDLTESYFLNKKIGCTAWKNNEHKCIYIVSQAQFSETLGHFSGVHIDNEKKFSVLGIPEDSFDTMRPDNSPLLHDQPNMDFLTIRK